VRLVEDLAPCPVPRWAVKTATAALVLLGAAGATAIDVYGADWADDAPDFDGFAAEGRDRTAARWADERATWDALVGWLAGRGCAVNRIAL
jgi:hypothetical protein